MNIPSTLHNVPSSDLPDDVVLSVQSVSKKFCRNLKRSMLYGMQDLGRNMLGFRAKTIDCRPSPIDHRLETGDQRSDTSSGQSRASIVNGQVSVFDGLTSNVPASSGSPLRKDEFWALQNISFELKRGETLGLIGSNGSGKSTMLRLLTGIFPPDAGQIAVRGRVGALIALGAGFHPHLTGRENIYLNGAILGMHKEEIDVKFKDIVSFSEIGEFMDAPVSTYSSGMYARLGFSIAVHVQPDLLLVDEVLSVGDMAFQLKCSERMSEYVKAGGTVVFVSHNLVMAQSLCQRMIWLDHGCSMMDAPASDVVSAYLENMDRRSVDSNLDEIRRNNTGTGDIRILKTVLRNKDGKECQEFRSGDALTVEIHYETAKRILEPYFWVGVECQFGSLFGANMLFDGCQPAYVEGKGIISCTLKFLPLLPQSYSVWGGIRPRDGALLLVQTRRLSGFQVVGKAADLGLITKVAESATRGSSPVLVPYVWHLPDGSTRGPSLDSLWR